MNKLKLKIIKDLFQKLTCLSLFIILATGCASKVIFENKMIVEGDKKEEREAGFPGAMFGVTGKVYDAFQSYDPPNSNISYIQIDKNECWNIGLASPFIPIPVIPIFKFPDNFQSHIGFRYSLKEEIRQKYLKDLEAILVVDNVNYKGKYKDKIRHSNGSTSGAYFEFEIKCTDIEKGEIIIKDKSNQHSFNFFRDSAFYYMW